MILCCSSPMVPAPTLTQKAELLRTWGYDAIAVFQPYEEWTERVHRELTGLEDATGVRPVEFVLTASIYGQAMAADPTVRAACRDMYRRAADVCGELGMVTEIEYEYRPQDPMPLFEPYQQLTPDQEQGFLTFYSELLSRIEGTSASVLLEPLNRYESRYLNSIADNLRIIENVNHPRAGLLPDTFHMSIEEQDMPQALREAGSRIRHVHLGENNRLLPGSGALDWATMFQALHDIGYTGAVNLECSTGTNPQESLPATAAFLNQFIDTH